MTKSMFLIYITLSIIIPFISFFFFDPWDVQTILCSGTLLSVVISGYIAHRNDKKSSEIVK